MAEIQLENISKVYPGADAPAVDALNLQIGKGEILTLLGPSGCGKTTTLRLIAGFEAPDSGAVFFDGRNVVGVPPQKRSIGMVFQDYALFPHLNVYDNVGFGLGRCKNRRRRIGSMIDLVGLAGLERQMPGRLSGGQQGRVALARALVPGPAVILLDEPFSSLDADLRVRIQREVTAIIKKAGTTALFVTHDQREAMTISDRIAVMEKGRLHQVGTPRGIYQHPETEFVATFVGRSNLLRGRIGADGRSITTEVGTVPCRHTHERKPGDEVIFCIRPCGFERDSRGPICGRIVKTAFIGENTDALLAVNSAESRKPVQFLVHIHPEEEVRVGEEVCFRVLPYFVAVVSEKGEKDENVCK